MICLPLVKGVGGILPEPAEGKGGMKGGRGDLEVEVIPSVTLDPNLHRALPGLSLSKELILEGSLWCQEET